MRSLNALQPLRRLLMYIRWWVCVRVWGMNIHPTARFSMSAKLDRTYPKGIHIGADTYLAFGACVLSHDMTRGLYLDTRIGRKCFIGARSMIMPGVTIGDGCIIGAGAVVVKDVPDGCAAAGNPAKIIKENIAVGRFGRLNSADAMENTLLHGGKDI